MAKNDFLYEFEEGILENLNDLNMCGVHRIKIRCEEDLTKNIIFTLTLVYFQIEKKLLI